MAIAPKVEISFDLVDFRTRELVYRDDAGTVQAFFEQSAVPEYDWIGAESDFGVSVGRLHQILPRIHDWAARLGLRLKICQQHELGL